MSIERFFASPFVARCALNVVFFLAVVMVLSVGFAATHHRPQDAVIDPCALVLDARSGQQQCR